MTTYIVDDGRPTTTANIPEVSRPRWCDCLDNAERLLAAAENLQPDMSAALVALADRYIELARIYRG